MTLILGGSALFAATRVGGDDRGLDPVRTGGTWQSIEPAPVSPRWDALSGWTGTEALFIGGGISTPCPPNADCVQPDEFARDGAAYNPTTHQWREIAPALVPMPYDFRSAMVGHTFVVFGDGDWYAYDAGDDAWRTLPQPPSTVRDPGFLSAADGKALCAGQSWGGPGARRRAGHVVGPASQRPATPAHAAHRGGRR